MDYKNLNAILTTAGAIGAGAVLAGCNDENLEVSNVDQSANVSCYNPLGQEEQLPWGTHEGAQLANNIAGNADAQFDLNYSQFLTTQCLIRYCIHRLQEGIFNQETGAMQLGSITQRSTDENIEVNITNIVDNFSGEYPEPPYGQRPLADFHNFFTTSDGVSTMNVPFTGSATIQGENFPFDYAFRAWLGQFPVDNVGNATLELGGAIDEGTIANASSTEFSQFHPCYTTSDSPDTCIVIAEE